MKHMNDIFDEEENMIYHSYLLQLDDNGQFSAFAETIKEIDLVELAFFLNENIKGTTKNKIIEELRKRQNQLKIFCSKVKTEYKEEN
jgi:site-specific DNA-cytosine methylase